MDSQKYSAVTLKSVHQLFVAVRQRRTTTAVKPPGKKELFSRQEVLLSVTAASSAFQHGGTGQDKILVKTDFLVHACFREKVREKLMSEPKMCTNTFKLPMKASFGFGVFFASL